MTFLSYLYIFIYYSSFIAISVDFILYTKYIFGITTGSLYTIESNTSFLSIILFIMLSLSLWRDIYAKQLYHSALNFGLFVSGVVVGIIFATTDQQVDHGIKTVYYDRLVFSSTISWFVYMINIIAISFTNPIDNNKKNGYVVINKDEIDLVSINIDDWECSICSGDSQEDVVRLKTCGHSYHSSCLTEWINKNNSCPLCRVTIETNYIDRDVPGNTQVEQI